MDRIFGLANIENKPYMIVDQLVPPSNLSRYVRYFNELIVFVVDRDPRDIYIEEKRYNWGPVPVDSVEDFCRWYEITRKHRKNEEFPPNVYVVQFEDMIYKYNETRDKLIKIVGLDISHLEKEKKIFDPDWSIKNTNLVKRFPEYREDVAYITERLHDYVYDFRKYE